MKQDTLLAALASVSGGITGIVAYFAFFGSAASGFNPLILIGFASAFSVAAALLSVASTAALRAFSLSAAQPENKTDLFVFSIPLLSVLALPVYAVFYEKLSSLSPSVFGNIYLPFHGFYHMNMAGFFLLSAAGAPWLAVFFITAARFITKFYRVSRLVNEKTARITLFFFAFIFYALSSSFTTLIYPPTGDEPHYLIAARSIAADFDVDLSNNYAESSASRRFFPSDLDYQNLHTVKGKNNEVLTTHDLGLSLLIAPFVKSGGRFTAQLFMNFTGALLCLTLYLMLQRLLISRGTAAASAMTAAVCMPLLAGSSLILTEVPAALITTYAVYALSAQNFKRQNVLFFALIAFLPWLHIKLSVFAAAFYIYYYYAVIKSRSFSLKQELLNNLPVVLSAAAYALFYYFAYGLSNPLGVKDLHENIYMDDPSQQMNTFVLNPLHFIVSFLAVLFDRDFGLLIYCPLFIFSVWGILRSAGKKQGLPAVFFAFIPYTLLFLFWKDWTGSMTPARQLIPLMPFFIFTAAYFLDNVNIYRTKLFAFLAGLSLFISWALAVFPPLRYLASKDKIYSFVSSRAPEQLLWLLPPFTASTVAGIIMSSVYMGLIVWGYYFYLRKIK